LRAIQKRHVAHRTSDRMAGSLAAKDGMAEPSAYSRLAYSRKSCWPLFASFQRSGQAVSSAILFGCATRGR
jgi:hypothetical protein